MDATPPQTPPRAPARGQSLPAGAPLPWTVRRPRIPRPLVADYGWVEEEAMHACGRDELLARARARQPLPMVWTPEQPELAWPEEVPQVFEALREGERESRRQGLWLPLGALALTGALAWQAGSVRSTAYLFAMLALVWTGMRLWALFGARDITPADLRGDVEMALHAGWLRARPSPWTRWLSGVLIAVGLAQLSMPLDESLLRAGLLKQAVREGEWWRLFASTLLHGNAIHFFFNFTALQSLGKLTEAHAHRAFLPVVFVVTALVGALASQLIGPGPLSVGASGGLLGLIGFLTVLGWRRRRSVPAGFFRAMLMDIALVGIIGVLGAAFIDNAAHAGGLLSGAALAALLVPREDAGPGVGWEPGGLLQAAGAASLALLTVGGAATALLLFGAR